ncbi:3-deoxy-7-phosphoheptulonate synthase [Treponema sp. HNW]|uniref:3-deoxy-7-phosphoheptulonate synthase n=1 Tax=Treponema sp. HNW TaxID=3116654 RepID=UPI003D145A6B
MVIVLKKEIDERRKDEVRSFLEAKGFRVNEIRGEEDTIFGAVGKLSIDPREVEILSGVERVIPISKPYKMASREFKKDNTLVEVTNNRGQTIRIGGSRFISIAGPCAVEHKEQMFDVARRVAAAGAVMLRGGAFKPRTSPYAFQGLGAEGIKILKEAGNAFGLPIVTEIVSADHIPDMIDYVDVYQIGARNMQNFELLKKVGALGKPVILKRGLSATIEEWLMAAEYLLSSGTDDVILCERGIRTYEKATRNTLDLSAIPVLKSLTHLPVIVDPSHAVGIRDKVPPMALAAAAAGADGIIVEVHCTPDTALSDGAQSLYPEQFEKLMRDIDVLAPLTGKETVRIRPAAADTDAGKNANRQENKAFDSLCCAFAGSRGAYAEQAARLYFDGALETLPCSNFRDVFRTVSEGRASCAIIPIENSLAGSVYENYDNLIRFSDISIAGSIKMRIEHALIACEGASLDTVKTVYSHPQALAQCSDFLALHPEWEQVECPSTSYAASSVAKKNDIHCAAIASQHAALCFKGGVKPEVLKTGIENNPRNYTRFLIIALNERPEQPSAQPLAGCTFVRRLAEQNRGALTASFAFVAKNESGALRRCLSVFEELHVNLTRLESRPVQGQPWRYMFYTDAELPDSFSASDGTGVSASAEDAAYLLVGQAVEGLKAACDEVHLLGIYTEVN